MPDRKQEVERNDAQEEDEEVERIEEHSGSVRWRVLAARGHGAKRTQAGSLARLRLPSRVTVRRALKRESKHFSIEGNELTPRGRPWLPDSFRLPTWRDLWHRGAGRHTRQRSIQ